MNTEHSKVKTTFINSLLFKLAKNFFEILAIASIAPVLSRGGAPSVVKFAGIAPPVGIDNFIIFGLLYCTCRFIANTKRELYLSQLLINARITVLNLMTKRAQGSSFFSDYEKNHIYLEDTKHIAKGEAMMVDIIADIVLIIMYLLYLLSISFSIVGLALIFIGMISVLSYTFKSRIDVTSKQHLNSLEDLTVLSNTFNFHMDYWRSFKEFEKIKSMLNDLSEKVSILKYKVPFFREIVSFIYEFCGIIFIGLLLYYFNAYDYTNSSAILSLAIFFRLTPSFFNLQKSFVSKKYGDISKVKIEKLKTHLSKTDMISHSGKVKLFPSKITSSFLKDLNGKNFEFNLDDKKSIAFYGPSGSGKTTLAKEIVYNSKDLLGVCTYVTDDVPILPGTITFNITLQDKINEKLLAECLNISGLGRLIEQDQYLSLSTVLKPVNCPLSSGQLQRISIARALYQQKPILIFDEAMNNLDESSELIIIEKIISSRFNSVFINICHRKYLLEKFEKIIIINDDHVARVSFG